MRYVLFSIVHIGEQHFLPGDEFESGSDDAHQLRMLGARLEPMPPGGYLTREQQQHVNTLRARALEALGLTDPETGELDP